MSASREMKPAHPREDRRKQILDAAMHIVGQRGYYGFSIKEVAVSCGLTVAGVLHHFGSKLQLLVDLLAEWHERDAMAILARLELSSVSPALMQLSDVLKILHGVVYHNSMQPEIVRLYSMLRAEALYPNHPAFTYFSERESNAQQILNTLLVGKVEDSNSASIHVMAVMSGLEYLWLRDPAGFDLMKEWDRAATRIFSASG